MYALLQVKEWLCLNCQMQRALKASDITGPFVKPETEANKVTVIQKVPPSEPDKSMKKELSEKKVEPSVPDSSQKRGSLTPGSPKKTQRAIVPPAANEPEAKTQPSQRTDQTPPNVQKVANAQKQTAQQSERDPEYKTGKPDVQQKSEKNTGSTDSQKVSEASKTTESLGGKMFGFGSSIFSSASNLISAVEQTTPPGSRKMSAPPQISGKISVSSKISPKTTPTVSPKMSPAREPKVLPQKLDQMTKPEESQLKKKDTGPSQPHVGIVSPRGSDGISICPLCNGEMNVGSKQTPNYNTCTECKTTVCNKCGFNPMPMVEVSTETNLP